MAEERALTVTEAMTRARSALETVSVRVVGEVSEFNDKPGYKAAYFTVCDRGAAMPCMMWRKEYRASGVELTCGSLVEMRGTFSSYIPKGRMQFMVKRLAVAGEGMLRAQVAELARRLEAEGLMRPERKRPLPVLPDRIAVVTSPRGKAIHDVIRTLRRRYPLAELLVAGVPVEGTDAPRAIVGGLEAAVQADPDVILLVRGGGSYEDLMPFNHEDVARAVVAASVPVVTGIGHEPDTSIADMVADVRASTPTAAAEAVAPSAQELAEGLSSRRRLLARALSHRLQSAEHRLGLVLRRPVFTDCATLLDPAERRIVQAGDTLRRAIPERLARDGERLAYSFDRMLRVGERLPDAAESRVEHNAARLRDLSPTRILERGYAVCFAADGTTIVRSVNDVGSGDRLNVMVSDGSIAATATTEGLRED